MSSGIKVPPPPPTPPPQPLALQQSDAVVLRGCDGTRFRVPAGTNVEAHWASGRERRILAAAMRQDPEAVVEAMLDGRDELDIPEGVGLLFLVACFNLVAAPVPEFRLAAGGPRSSSDAVAAAGGLAFCLSIVDGYPYSRRIQLNGLRALGSVALGSPQHATSVYAAGGLPIVFRALDLHQDHPGTLERAAFAIGAVIGGTRNGLLITGGMAGASEEDKNKASGKNDDYNGGSGRGQAARR